MNRPILKFALWFTNTLYRWSLKNSTGHRPSKRTEEEEKNAQQNQPQQPVAKPYNCYSYVAPDPIISPLLMARVVEEINKTKEPDRMQSELNGCLECMRSRPAQGFIAYFMAELIQKGYPTEEATLRLMANLLHLGMLMERKAGPVVVIADSFPASLTPAAVPPPEPAGANRT